MLTQVDKPTAVGRADARHGFSGSRYEIVTIVVE